MHGVRVVIGMQESPVQIFTTNYLLDHLSVEAVLVERPRRKRSNRPMALLRRLGPVRGAARILDLAYLKARSRLARIAERERNLLFPDGAPVALRDGAPVHEVASINSKRARKLLQDLQPDILVINGTSIVKEPIIRLAGTAAINLHTGVVPDFRGCTPEFWALYHDRHDAVGATVHHLEPAIDAGDVILSARTSVSPRDDDVSLRCRNGRLGARLLVEAVRLLAAGEAPRTPQDASSGGYYSHRNLWQDMALRWKLWRRRPRGMAGLERGSGADD